MLEIIENRNNNIMKFNELKIGDIFKIADSEYIRELVYTYIPPSSFSKKPERERKKIPLII